MVEAAADADARIVQAQSVCACAYCQGCRVVLLLHAIALAYLDLSSANKALGLEASGACLDIMVSGLSGAGWCPLGMLTLPP